MDQKDALQIRPAWAEDWPALRQLLQTCGLIETGVAAQLDRVRVATWRGRIVGMALLERYAEGGLLRSVAVEPAWQGRGIGRRLVDVMLEEARREGLSQVFLLTETAADFFRPAGLRARHPGGGSGLGTCGSAVYLPVPGQQSGNVSYPPINFFILYHR